MSRALVELPDRTVLDTGEVAFALTGLARLILEDRLDEARLALDHPDIRKFLYRNEFPITIWAPGEPEGPKPETHEWLIPPGYLALDLRERCTAEIDRRQLGLAHRERLDAELAYIQQHSMQEFFCAIVFVVERFREQRVLWGVGRGSSCGSLVLFLLGVNLIDPVRYQIPMEEFFKPEPMNETSDARK